MWKKIIDKMFLKNNLKLFNCSLQKTNYVFKTHLSLLCRKNNKFDTAKDNNQSNKSNNGEVNCDSDKGSCSQKETFEGPLRALAYFSSVYPSFYPKEKWEQQLLPGLLNTPKYFAIANPFLPPEEGGDGKEGQGTLKHRLEEMGALNLRTVWEKGRSPSSSPKWVWPSNIDAYYFPSGGGLQFPRPRILTNKRLSEYILINGGSLIPVLALGLKEGEEKKDVLDLCAGPGMKCLIVMMTDSFRTLTCNDLKPNRVKRIRQVFKAFTGREENEGVFFPFSDGTNFKGDKKFQRILVDAPCQNDRASLIKRNNIFNDDRREERLDLEMLQKRLLLAAFENVDSEGVIIYSSCTLHSGQNDGVVGAALEAKSSTNNRKLSVDNEGLLSLIEPFLKADIFNVSVSTFGILIEPGEEAKNYGPMFISRIVN